MLKTSIAGVGIAESYSHANKTHQVKLQKLGYFLVRGSSWILKYLTVEESKRLVILYDGDSSTRSVAIDFINSIDRVNELVIDGSLLNAEHSLQLKFKWSKVYIDLQRIVEKPQNIKNLLNAAENDSLLSLVVTDANGGVSTFHQIMNELSSINNSRIKTFAVNLSDGVVSQFADFELSPPVLGIKHLYVSFDFAWYTLSDQRKLKLESCLSCFPNAETVVIDKTSFAIRPENCLELMKNVKDLTIAAWDDDADFDRYIMPKLKHLKICLISPDKWDEMQKFLDENSQVETFQVVVC